MVGLTPVAALIAGFVWLGFASAEYNRAARLRLLGLIAAILLLTWAWGALAGPPATPSLDTP